MMQIMPRYQVLQGEVSQLRTQSTHVHYLKNIKQQQELAKTVAVLQAAVGQAGAIHSAQAATDEGDPVEGFTMQVDSKRVSGSFWKTTFNNGDHVQVIGQERNGVFEAVAVIKPTDRVIWMQPHCERGTAAKRAHLFKCSGWFILFCYTCALLLGTFSSLPIWFMLLGATIITPLILIVTVGLSWNDFMTFSRELNAVGSALGFSHPENIDLIKTTKLAKKNGKPDLPLGVYYY